MFSDSYVVRVWGWGLGEREMFVVSRTCTLHGRFLWTMINPPGSLFNTEYLQSLQKANVPNCDLDGGSSSISLASKRSSSLPTVVKRVSVFVIRTVLVSRYSSGGVTLH